MCGTMAAAADTDTDEWTAPYADHSSHGMTDVCVIAVAFTWQSEPNVAAGAS